MISNLKSASYKLVLVFNLHLLLENSSKKGKEIDIVTLGSDTPP